MLRMVSMVNRVRMVSTVKPRPTRSDGRLLAHVAIAALGVGLGAPVLAAATGLDWPQIRGPRRDGVSDEQGLSRQWPADGPPVVFRRAIGEGFSGIAVVGNRLFTMSSAEGKETVLVADALTGATVWETPVDELFVEEFGNGPRSTPAVDDSRVYAASSRGKLVALDRTTGGLLWQVDLLATHQAPQPLRGFAPSPLLDAGQLLIEVGGGERRGLVALEASTGKLRWTTADTRTGYSSPILATLAGVRQYVVVAGNGQEILGLGRAGEVLWRHAWNGGAIAMPVAVGDDRVFVSTQLDQGSLLLAIERGAEGKLAARELWQSRHMKNHFNSSVLVGAHLFGFDNASLRCIDVATGEPRWVARGLGKGSLIAADGLLFVLGDRGQLVLAAANGDAWTELGRFQAMTGKAWTQPSLAHGRLYLRDQDELVALDVRAADGGQP
jgi:outer membrane protein assembly factor BamB